MNASIVFTLLLVAGFWLLVTGYWFLVTGCWLLVTGFWLLVTGCWLLVTGCWLLVTGYWSLVTGCWLLVTCYGYLLLVGHLMLFAAQSRSHTTATNLISFLTQNHKLTGIEDLSNAISSPYVYRPEIWLYEPQASCP
jgi:hypothetical protein